MSNQSAWLGKLLRLLEDGKSSAIKEAAAIQVLESVKAMPSLIPTVLQKVQALLYNKDWDTRVAASKVLSLLSGHMSHFSPSHLAAPSDGEQEDIDVSDESLGSFGLESFSIASILKKGSLLLESSGQAYDPPAGQLSKEMLAEQKKALKQRLGIKGALGSVMDTDDLVEDKDLVTAQVTKTDKEKAEASSLLNQMQGLSARERNQLKRKLKAAASQPSGRNQKRKLSASSETAAGDATVSKAETALSWEDMCNGQWPFQMVADCWVVDCLHQVWETRHGAVLALRELLTSQAACAAVHVHVVPDTGWAKDNGTGHMRLGQVDFKQGKEAKIRNREWLEDTVIHLLCVLALDRFADFISDQIIAPVRETAAQALGLACRPLPSASVTKIAESLEQLTRHDNWNVQHAGLLGIKYLLAARSDLRDTLLKRLMPTIIAGLRGNTDDVRASAADSLLPAVDLMNDWPSASLDSLRDPLWSILSSSDDLSLAPGSVMGLVAELTSCRLFSLSEHCSSLAVRLLPYFRHNLVLVRQQAVKCLLAVFKSEETACRALSPEVLKLAIPAVFLNLLLESNQTVLATSEEAWRQMVSHSNSSDLCGVSSTAKLDAMITLMSRAESSALNDTCIDHACVENLLPPKDTQLLRIYKACKFPEDYDLVRMRFLCSSALAQLAIQLDTDLQATFFKLVKAHLADESRASNRQIGALICSRYVKEKQLSANASSGTSDAALPGDVCTACLKVLGAPASNRSADMRLISYQELNPLYRRVQGTGTRFLKQCLTQQVDVAPVLQGIPPERYMKMLTADNAMKMLELINPGQDPNIVAAKEELCAEVKSLAEEEAQVHNQVKALVAAAIIRNRQLPGKFNVVIQPIMAALRKEANGLIRGEMAAGLAELIHICSSKPASPNEKILGNLVNLIVKKPVAKAVEQGDVGSKARTNGKASGPLQALDIPMQALEEAQNEAQIAFKGASQALVAISSRFGSKILTGLPSLQSLIGTGFRAASTGTDSQEALRAIHALAVIGPSMAPELNKSLLEDLEPLVHCLGNEDAQIQSLAAECIAALVKKDLHTFLPVALQLGLPLLEDGQNGVKQMGGVQMVAELTDVLGQSMGAYLFLVIVPVMRLINSQNPVLRSSATPVFATLVSLLPIVQGMAAPDSLSVEQQAQWRQHRKLLHQLLDGSEVPEFDPKFVVNGQLRQYQKEGISWMAFLARCGLHGILADDMGLGKTLQATLTLAVSHTEARMLGRKVKPSLVVCPPILVGHWTLEVSKFVGRDVLTPLGYEGNPSARAGQQKRFASVDVVVMSYDTLRADSAAILNHDWNYCVLDEGHVIRNPKAKITQAVKQVRCEHRLMLSGTPIQNNVQELWALFDFLMPGFLGTETAFFSRYGKALLGGRMAKTGSAEAQKALLAMNGLHKQVAPFILRRTKDSVLKDLPPKIIQDIYCQLSPLQAALYQDWDGSDASKQLQDSVFSKGGAVQDSAPHIFQALQYLRKLCSHPLLVLDPANHSHTEAVQRITQINSWSKSQPSLHSLEHAPKLQALQQLLEQCDIGLSPKTDNSTDDGTEKESRQALHRVLVFAQYKAFLDIVEKDVMRPRQIPFLRLDGSVEASQRFPIVQRFNEDASIPVMLLTTGVGGLGLNLTAADTVIFLEHDWNPMKDMQAMDRAHRIGQKNTVNVYRLLMKDSLEERVLGLQRFKVDVANTVINEENTTGGSLLSGAVLEVLGTDNKETSTKAPPDKATGLKSVLDNLEALWDEQQYGNEFSLSNFAQKLNE